MYPPSPLGLEIVSPDIWYTLRSITLLLSLVLYNLFFENFRRFSIINSKTMTLVPVHQIIYNELRICE